MLRLRLPVVSGLVEASGQRAFAAATSRHSILVAELGLHARLNGANDSLLRPRRHSRLAIPAPRSAIWPPL